MKTGKVWGTTELLLRTPLIEVHRLTVLPHSRCSMHRHLHKWNAFFVLTGQLTIDVEKSNYDLTDVTVVNPTELTAVAPGDFHRFRTGKNGAQAIEIYYPAELSDDIVRRDVGMRRRWGTGHDPKVAAKAGGRRKTKIQGRRNR